MLFSEKGIARHCKALAVQGTSTARHWHCKALAMQGTGTAWHCRKGIGCKEERQCLILVRKAPQARAPKARPPRRLALHTAQKGQSVL